MRSSNIGKFVAENVRECEESFETFKDNVVISETMFDGVLTEVAVNSVPQKPLEPPTVQRDLRTTLNSRTISRDIPALFRGQCFAWLRFGSCRVRITCRFLHSVSILVNFYFSSYKIYAFRDKIKNDALII